METELTPEQYDVLRQEGTERPFTSPAVKEHRAGTFVCAGCGLELFPSKPNLTAAPAGRVSSRPSPGNRNQERPQTRMARTEYHCARCGGHQGHVFNDGPQPTGLRYCNNGVALKFIPKKTEQIMNPSNASLLSKGWR